MQQISDKLNHYKLAQAYIIEGFPRDKDQLEDFYKQVKLARRLLKCALVNNCINYILPMIKISPHLQYSPLDF